MGLRWDSWGKTLSTALTSRGLPPDDSTNNRQLHPESDPGLQDSSMPKGESGASNHRQLINTDETVKARTRNKDGKYMSKPNRCHWGRLSWGTSRRLVKSRSLVVAAVTMDSDTHAKHRERDVIRSSFEHASSRSRVMSYSIYPPYRFMKHIQEIPPRHPST